MRARVLSRPLLSSFSIAHTRSLLFYPQTRPPQLAQATSPTKAPHPARAYATNSTPSSDSVTAASQSGSTHAPPISDSARELAEHLAQHPEKAGFMIEMVGKQVRSLREEVDKPGRGYEAAETVAVLGALGATLRAIRAGLEDQGLKGRVDGMLGEIEETSARARK